MDILKEYYIEQSASQPNLSLEIDHLPLKARRLTLQKYIVVAVIIIMSFSLTTIAYAAVSRFVDRAVVGTSHQFVVVADESQEGHYRSGYPLSPAAGEVQAEELIPSEGLVCTKHDGMTCLEPVHAGLFCAGSYEEAAALLERDFRLPDIELGYSVNLYEMQMPTGPTEADGSYQGAFYDLVVVMHYIKNDPMDSHNLFIYRVTRGDTSFIPDVEIRVAGSIEELYFNDVKVYAIFRDGFPLRYIWEHDGLTYDIFARSGISHAEYLRIISSMIQ